MSARPAESLADARTVRRAVHLAVAVACYFVLRSAAWDVAPTGLRWLLTAGGVGLLSWQWGAMSAAYKVDPTFGRRGKATSFAFVPFGVGLVLSLRDVVALVR